MVSVQIPFEVKIPSPMTCKSIRPSMSTWTFVGEVSATGNIFTTSPTECQLIYNEASNIFPNLWKRGGGGWKKVFFYLHRSYKFNLQTGRLEGCRFELREFLTASNGELLSTYVVLVRNTYLRTELPNQKYLSSD